MQIEIGVSQLAIGVMLMARRVMLIGSGVSQIAKFVMPILIRVMLMTMVVMPTASGVVQMATVVMSAVAGVTHGAMAAVCEEMAVSPLSAGAMAIPNGASSRRPRAFHVAAGGAHGSGRVVPIPAVVRPLPVAAMPALPAGAN